MDLPESETRSPFDTNNDALTALTDPSLAPLFWRAERIGSPSAWWEHVPFAHWIVSATEPALLVELGTHAGVSYSAFCQAVVRAQLPTRCHAVDTWIGDPQAGEYGEDVFTELQRFHEDRFASFSTLLRCTFNEALNRIEDGAIDLLHIDGFHTYAAVHDDFESWLPKLSERAVVLFHDTNEREADFGVWRLWSELRGRYPSFEFLHGHGLGVIAVGHRVPDAISALCRLDPAAVGSVRARFARLGERWLHETRERMLARELDARLALAASEADRLQAEASAHADRALAEGQSAVAAIARAERAEAARDEAKSARGRADTALAKRDLDEAALHARTEAQVAAAQQETLATVTRSAQAEAAAATAAKQVARINADLSQRTAERDRAIAGRDHAIAERQAAREERDQLGIAFDQLLSSTIWRATWPLRSLARVTPPALRRGVRGGLKLAWWTVTLKLPGRLRSRRMPLLATPAPETVSESPAIHDQPVVDPPAEFHQPRLVYISGEPWSPGHQYRVMRPMAAAAAAGMRTSWMPVEEIPSRLAEIEAADALVIWRAAWGDNVSLAVQTAKRSHARVVFDIDDLMIVPELARLDVIDGIRTQNLTEDMVRDCYAGMRDTMFAADLCLVTTEELAEHARGQWVPTMVLPNGLDHAGIAASRLAARRRAASGDGDGLFRIGYAGGSRTHQRDFAQCADAVADVLSRRPDCRLVLFRSTDRSFPVLDLHEFPKLFEVESQIEWRDFVPLELLPNEMARFDINLAPLEAGNPFCEAKSELKLFEAALVDVPTIASPTGPYRRAMRHGQTGLLARSATDWATALAQLLDDPSLRRRMANAAGREALWRFGPERRVEMMSTLLQSLQHGRPAAQAFARQIARADDQVSEPKLAGCEPVFQSDRLGTAEVTIVVPLYNYADYVEEALDSARAQTLAALDLVIVEDRSTDDSLDVALRWVQANAARFNRVLLLRNHANSGLACARNNGFEAAGTPYVLALDADNRLFPDCALACLQTARRRGAGIAYPRLQMFGARTETMGDRPFDPQRLRLGNYIDAMALVSKAAWVAAGGYDLGRGGWEDYGFLCRIIEHGLWGEKVAGPPLAEYRVHAASMTSAAWNQPSIIRRMMKDLSGGHPWLRLVDIEEIARQIQEAVSKTAEPTPSSDLDPRLARLLPMLRCPETGQNLVLSTDQSTLLSADSSVHWPLVAGRPMLFPGMDAAQVNDDSHISNALPPSALAIIHSTTEPILHLSAGGSAERFEHVIEAEAAVFRHTDVICDVHRLPFEDETFAAVIALNAFEHYRDPQTAAAEILRVLRPGGRVLIRTAFLQPLHEAPWHFFNCTRYGLEAWFEAFETETLHVSDNFHPGYSLSWLTSGLEIALRSRISGAAADDFLATPIGTIVSLWRTPGTAHAQTPLWGELAALPQDVQEAMAAGFEYIGRRPGG